MRINNTHMMLTNIYKYYRSRSIIFINQLKSETTDKNFNSLKLAILNIQSD